MLEIWSEEFSPDSFWPQTAATFTASLRGRLEANKRQAERDLALAYHTGAFSRASKVRKLEHYMRQLRGGTDASRGGVELLGAFRTMKKKGVPVQIRRLN